MHIPKRVSILLLAGALFLVVASFAAYRSVKWAFGVVRQNYLVVSASQLPQQTSQPVQSTSSALPDQSVRVPGSAMAQAFRNGKLPSPMPIPSGKPDDAVADLAKKVAAQDEQSTAALMTALQISGFSIRGEGGMNNVEAVKPGQGIVFDAWEVAAMAKLYGDGMQIKLADLSTAFSSQIVPLKDAHVAALLVDGIRTAAQGNQPAKRCWARFIAELGRRSAQPYDLLSQNVDLATVNLDGIQVSLILRRFVADLMIMDQDKSEKHIASARERETDLSFRRPQPVHCAYRNRRELPLNDAVWRPEGVVRLQFVQEGSNSQLPCTLAELAAQILDSSAYLSGYGFDKLTEYLKEHGMPGPATYSKKVAPVINGILAIIKLIAYFACLDTDITMNGSPPLVRTQSIYQDGDRRTLTATVREDLGKWQELNCVRIALNAAGIDFSLPNDGPQANVGIQWVLVGGGASINHDTGEINWPFVELLFPENAPTIQTATGPFSNATAPKTDEKGQATIDIEGLRQKQDLGPNPGRVMKQAEVRFTCEPKPISMAQDLIDAGGNGYLAGPVGLIVGGPVEMLLRSKIHFSKPIFIPVVDWQPCNGGWTGTITYSATTTHHETSSYPGYSITYDTHNTTTVEANLRGSDSSGAWEGPSYASVFAHGDNHESDVSSVGTCERTDSISGSVDADIAINEIGDNQFNVTGVSEIPVSGEHKESGTCKLTNHMAATWSLPAFTATVDPHNPDVLQGSRELTEEEFPGRTAKITWNLRRCGR